MKIWAKLRVKNEGRWVRRVIESFSHVCEAVMVMDDGSSDNTRQEAEKAGAVVLSSPFASQHLDEARDKDWLLSKVREVGAVPGDWCLAVDGDEEMAPGDAEKLMDLAQQPVRAWSFRILYLWDSPNQIRVDNVYGRFRRASFFRIAPQQTFRRTDFGGNFHCASVPSDCIGQWRDSDIRLLHYGYMHREDRVRKYEFYNRIDPGNAVEDGYRHIVIGDLFPAESCFRWGGPLQLQSL